MSYLGSYVGGYLGSYLGPRLVPDVILDDAVAPVIAVSPGAGTQIQASTVMTIDITDDVGLLVTAIFATFPSGVEDIVYDSVAFGVHYQERLVNRRLSIAGGRRFTVRRDGGWIGSPSFRYLVVDRAGNFGVLA